MILARLDRDANDIDVDREVAVEFLKRTIFHPGKTKCEEQKREAAEKYEERCEPSINKLTGSRYCPDIQKWDAFKNYEVGGGYGHHQSAIQFLKHTFFDSSSTKCEEQKRKAKENYEEHCEPLLPWNRNRINNPHRYCPELSIWEAFATYEVGDGDIPNLNYLERNIKIS